MSLLAWSLKLDVRRFPVPSIKAGLKFREFFIFSSNRLQTLHRSSATWCLPAFSYCSQVAVFKVLSWSSTHLSTVATLTALFFEVEEAEEELTDSPSRRCDRLDILSTSSARRCHCLTDYDVILLGAAHAHYFDLSLCPTNDLMVYTKPNFVRKLSDDRLLLRALLLSAYFLLSA